jgi:tRNA nucleotidyltransferase (CCA-adding enzyme)
MKPSPKGETCVQAEIPDFITEAAKAFSANGTPLYLVGGWPRNRLLGLPPGDLDVASALPPDEAAALFKQAGCVKVAEKNKRLGTLGVFAGGLEAEYTAFRTESYGAGGAHRPEDVHFGATMREDALRRDFTVNALYHDIAANEDADPLGGLPDVGLKMLRTCRKPEETFADDGLRLMRLARLAAELGFGIEGETRSTAKDKAGLILDIAPERIQAELNRLLLADTRYPDLKREQNPVLYGLRLLDGLGLLARVAPEFERCRGVTQRADYHDHDVLEHLFRTCACAPPALELRLAALLHDIGKPEALRQGGKMLGHDKLGEAMAKEMLARLRYPGAVIAEVATLVRRHMYDLDGKTGEKRLRLFFVKMGRERSRRLIALRRADVCGSRDEPSPADPAAKWESLLERMDAQGVPWTQRELRIDGGDLAKLAGGPSATVGGLKRALHAHAVLHPEDNDRETLRRLAGQMINDRQRFPGRRDD